MSLPTIIISLSDHLVYYDSMATCHACGSTVTCNLSKGTILQDHRLACHIALQNTLGYGFEECIA